jgi:hypothetical protein
VLNCNTKKIEIQLFNSKNNESSKSNSKQRDGSKKVSASFESERKKENSIKDLKRDIPVHEKEIRQSKELRMSTNNKNTNLEPIVKNYTSSFSCINSLDPAPKHKYQNSYCSSNLSSATERNFGGISSNINTDKFNSKLKNNSKIKNLKIDLNLNMNMNNNKNIKETKENTHNQINYLLSNEEIFFHFPKTTTSAKSQLTYSTFASKSTKACDLVALKQGSQHNNKYSNLNTFSTINTHSTNFTHRMSGSTYAGNLSQKNKIIIKNNMNKYNMYPSYYNPNQNPTSKIEKDYKKSLVKKSELNSQSKENNTDPNSPKNQTKKNGYFCKENLINKHNNSNEKDITATIFHHKDKNLKTDFVNNYLTAHNFKEVISIPLPKNEDVQINQIKNNLNINPKKSKQKDDLFYVDKNKTIKNLACLENDKLIKDYELDNSEEQIERLIHKNSELIEINKNRRMVNRGIGQSCFEIRRNLLNKDKSLNKFLLNCSPKKEDSLLFSSFNSEIYKNLNDNPNSMQEIMNDKNLINLSIDIASIQNNEELIQLNIEEDNFNIGLTLDKTENTQCQYDDIVFTKNSEEKRENNPIKNQVLLDKINDCVNNLNKIDEKLMNEIDDTVNLNSIVEGSLENEIWRDEILQVKEKLPISELK